MRARVISRVNLSNLSIRIFELKKIKKRPRMKTYIVSVKREEKKAL